MRTISALKIYFSIITWSCAFFPAFSQHKHITAETVITGVTVDAQPLLAQVLRLRDALEFLGSPLNPDDSRTLSSLKDHTPDREMVTKIQALLDSYCLATVQINPEARVP